MKKVNPHIKNPKVDEKQKKHIMKVLTNVGQVLNMEG
jgi:hypothetical protein